MRYSPHTPAERESMLRAIGVKEIGDLFADIPKDLRYDRPLEVPQGLTEMELGRHLADLAGRNHDAQHYLSFLGGGAYDRFIPSVVGEFVRRSEFYTSYTPYQPEISQGTLQAIWEFQSLIAILTGLDVAQASLYDGATAMAEAAMLALGHTGRRRLVVLGSLNPFYRRVLSTYAYGHDAEVVEVATRDGLVDLDALRAQLSDDVAAVLAQSPNFFGALEDMEAIGEMAHAHGALFVAVVDPISLGILKPPGAYGADVAVGEGQSLGIPMAFGGPYLGFMAARKELVRRMPGRIAGRTVDMQDRQGFVLTLQTREQHIRRERATSNVCTNQGLMAMAATIYLSLMGGHGLRRAAELSLEGAHDAAQRLSSLKHFKLAHRAAFFQEFVLETDLDIDALLARMEERGVLAGVNLGRLDPAWHGRMLVAVTEQRTADDIERLVRGLEECAS